jgi:hypothetical protein
MDRVLNVSRSLEFFGRRKVKLPIRLAWSLLVAWTTVAGASSVELKLGNATVQPGGTVEIPLLLTSDQPVQGFVAAFDWNPTHLQGISLLPGSVLTDADTVVRRVEPNYMVLGVVMDSDGTGGEIIAPGTDIQLATVRLQCLALPQNTPIVFRDGMYATVNGGPLLDNIVVIGGLSIGMPEGLVLTNGNVTCVPVPAAGWMGLTIMGGLLIRRRAV